MPNTNMPSSSTDVAPGQKWKETDPLSKGRTFLVNELAGDTAVLTFDDGRRGRVPTHRLVCAGAMFEKVSDLPRDPRSDPREGDVVLIGDGTTFHIRDRCDGNVVYQQNGTGELLRHELDQWIVDSAHDIIVAVAA